jgi:two-component system CheB/CheR fusion protein
MPAEKNVQFEALLDYLKRSRGFDFTGYKRSILARLHFALNDAGFLFLGKAEMLLTHANLFNPTDLKHRVFTKTPRVNLPDRLIVLAQAGDAEAAHHLGRQVRLRETAFDVSPVAQWVVDANGSLALAMDMPSRCSAFRPRPRCCSGPGDLLPAG